MKQSRCDCSLIIPTRDRHEILSATLGRIMRLTDQHFEVIIVNNGSTDRTPSLRKRFTSVRWIDLDRNHGAAARNVGANAARGRIIFMLDDDSWPEDGTIERAVNLFDRRADLGAVACRVRLTDPPSRHDAGGVPGIFFNCGGIIRRSAFVEAGGFPADFVYYVEEYDLCCRLWQQGWHIEPRGDLQVRHRRVSTNRDNNRMLRLLVRNNLRLWEKYAPPDQLDDLIDSSVDRYLRVAQKEQALEGFCIGLQEGSAEIAGGLIKRHPMSTDRLEKMFGLPTAKRVVRRWADKHNIRNVAVWSRGKGCEQLLKVLNLAGIHTDAVYDEACVDQCWRQIPLRRQDLFNPETVDGIVVGSLSPGVAEDLRRALSERFHHMPVVSAAPWTEEPVPLALAV
ncbi:MAG: glycosyltransferase [Phycisphaerales bacterium]|nr:glycosyltransferase [Phycisphaerales bacterium]